MKILSNEQYEKLLANASSKKYTDEEIKALEFSLENYQDQIRELTRDNENLSKDQEILLKRKELEVKNEVLAATANLTAENQKLTMENNNSKKEAEILTKAFENLGFDVKDMKEILNKLVDGVVSKNQIQLVK